MPYKVIKKKYVYDAVFEQLRENIYRGDIKFGERLLPEREMAELMQVSRATVRKAIDQLLSMGYIEKRGMGGYFVKIPVPQDSHNPFSNIMTPRKSSLDELMEVRIGLESYGVLLATERAVDQDLVFLKQAYVELSEEQPDKEKALNADIKFHMGIAFATHNSVYIDLVRRFYDYMFHSINKLHSLLYEKHSNLKIIEKQHFQILEAITSRDSTNAKRHMLQHITFLRSFLKGERAWNT